MTPVLRNRLIGVAIAFAIYAADQVVKWWVDGPLGLKRQHDKMDLLPFFDLYRIHNYGVSLGMFEATSPETRWLLVGVTALIALLVTVWMFREKLLGDILGLSLILGGALGNIKDRYELGYVLDYADFHIGDFRPFLIFNIADAAITIGVVIILARAFFMSDKEVDDMMDGKTADAAESNT
ncbi:signal peptidase II [Qipengyuania sp. GH38]|uniref:signal peptidase II n=1 Tax=Qipengyuania intermedia TaxID=2867244 RepID=UPI001C867B77|nr:signal peptidase II [Qipengyuania intermedia]MBX7513868.1 signal peptidase II [Qipengyuania intermedia]